MSADAFENIAQVSEGIETQPFGGGDQAGQRRGGPASVVASVERPIAATDSDATQVTQAYLAPREAFFLFSAHRFFIMSDRRFLPSGVRWRRFLARGARTLAAGDAFGGVGGKSVPSKASIAVFSRSRSRFNSFTIA